MQSEIHEKKRYKFNSAGLAANSAIASAGAGLAMAAATGLVLPAVLAAALGGFVGYSATNKIPENSK